MTPVVLQFIGDLISYDSPVCRHLCVFVIPGGEKAQTLHNSPQYLKPLRTLRGPLFGGIYARINKSLMFLCLLYATTDGFSKHSFITGDSSVMT